jgi:hypothetical protein
MESPQRRVASILLRFEAARFFLLPPMREPDRKGMRRPHVVMNKMKRMLMAALMGCVVSAGAFAQKQDPKPPPKIETPKVRTQEKDPPPPPPPKNDDKKKP